jgi:hypothetical protein
MKLTSHDTRILGEWRHSVSIARWNLADIDAAAIQVAADQGAEKTVLSVVLPCRSSQACVDRKDAGRDSRAHLEFTSVQIAQHVAAAFRHAATLCQES